MLSGNTHSLWKSNPNKSDPEIMKYGKTLLQFNAILLDNHDIEIWVQKVSELSGEKVDWQSEIE